MNKEELLRILIRNTEEELRGRYSGGGVEAARAKAKLSDYYLELSHFVESREVKGYVLKAEGLNDEAYSLFTKEKVFPDLLNALNQKILIYAEKAEFEDTQLKKESLAKALRYAIRLLWVSKNVKDKKVAAFILNNIGNLLGRLSVHVEPEIKEKYLKRALSAFEEALRALDKDDSPADYAMAYNNMGNILNSIARSEEGEAGEKSLDEAASAFRTALKIFSKSDFPYHYARTISNLGNALSMKGVMVAERGEKKEAERLFNEADGLYLSALDIFRRENRDFEFVNTLSGRAANFGRHSSIYEDKVKVAQFLKESETVALKVLEYLSIDRSPETFAMVQKNLGHTLHSLAKSAEPSEVATLQKRSESAFLAASKVYTREVFPSEYASLNLDLALLYIDIASAVNDNSEKLLNLNNAQDILQSLKDTIPEGLEPFYLPAIQNAYEEMENVQKQVSVPE